MDVWCYRDGQTKELHDWRDDESGGEISIPRKYRKEGVVLTYLGKGCRIFGEKSDEYRCGGEERSTRAVVGGQCKCGLEGEETVGGGDANMAAFRQLVRNIEPP